MQHTFLYVESHRLKPSSGFTPAVLRKAQDLLDDDFRTAEGNGYISDGEVLRTVNALVWQAMREMEQERESTAMH